MTTRLRPRKERMLIVFFRIRANRFRHPGRRFVEDQAIRCPCRRASHDESQCRFGFVPHAVPLTGSECHRVADADLLLDAVDDHDALPAGDVINFLHDFVIVRLHRDARRDDDIGDTQLPRSRVSRARNLARDRLVVGLIPRLLFDLHDIEPARWSGGRGLRGYSRQRGHGERHEGVAGTIKAEKIHGAQPARPVPRPRARRAQNFHSTPPNAPKLSAG